MTNYFLLFGSSSLVVLVVFLDDSCFYKHEFILLRRADQHSLPSLIVGTCQLDILVSELRSSAGWKTDNGPGLNWSWVANLSWWGSRGLTRPSTDQRSEMKEKTMSLPVSEAAEQGGAASYRGPVTGIYRSRM